MLTGKRCCVSTKGRTKRLPITPILITSLLMSTSLASADDDRTAKLEERMARLEQMLAKIVSRLDSAEAALTAPEIEVVEKARRLVQEEVEEQVAAAVNEETQGMQDGFSIGGTKFKLGGYLKADINTTRYSDGAPASINPGRIFYIPSTIPVAGGSNPQWASNISTRESRFNIIGERDVDGHLMRGVFELDFLITPIGDERVSNSYAPRMRHAYLQYRGFTVGQAWSTWMDLSTLPDTLDFVGATEATNFNRQPLIRYKTGGLEVALEQPETTITDPVTGARAIPGTDDLPDFIARYRTTGDWGHIQTTGMLRNLTLEANLLPGAVNDNALGYGLSLSGKLNLGEHNDIRFMATAGEGIGRYQGVNVVNGATLDSEGRLDLIGTVSGYAALRHEWNDLWRSSVVFGYMKASHPNGIQVGTDEVLSLHTNLIYSPSPKWKMGVEYIYAERTLESGVAGTINRFQFSTKFNF